MGIRHIAGPRAWGAYQQAILVCEMKDDENLEFRDIGQMLGISSVEAARRYRAIGALKVMEADELFSSRAEPGFYKLFHELVSLPEVRTKFGWSAEQSTFSDIEKARQFFDLISSDGRDEPKLKTYGDVRKLKSIFGNSKAEESLFDPEQSLSEAIRIGEQGRVAVDIADLLNEAKASLASISFVQVQKLTPKDLLVVDDLLKLLEQLKSTAPQSAEPSSK